MGIAPEREAGWVRGMRRLVFLTANLLAAAVLAASALAETARGAAVDPAASTAAVEALQAWLERPRAERPDLESESFAATALTKEDAGRAKSMLWDDYAADLREKRAEEMKARQIEIDGRTLRFDWRATGEKPADGHSLFISLHGGGNARPSVNDRQWANQIRLGDAYRPKEGIYVAPRAPTDTWNLWHEAHIDALFDRLIQNFIVLEGVNPDRVYLLGYSAGGDGVYQVAPRFADRLAAASMMAGHPNEASPLGLRNIGFALHVGALDGAYRRNEVAREWGERLADLHKADPDGYKTQVEIHEGKRHWMDLEDSKAIAWMEEFTRTPWPAVVVWRQDDVIHERFYWLAVPRAEARAGDEVTARLEGDAITLRTSRPLDLTLLLDDALLDLDQPVTVKSQDGAILHAGHVTRSVAALHRSLLSRGQKPLMAAARLDLATLPLSEKK